MVTYKIKIDAFEGPFDLLFHLIEKNKFDINDIPISLITDQYLDYISSMREMDLDVTSEFLVMASTLLHIKSRMLLPAPPADDGDEGRDPRDELVVSMREYKKYRDFTASLRKNASYWGEARYRPAGYDDSEESDNYYVHDEPLKKTSGQLSLYDMDGGRLCETYRRLMEINRLRHDNLNQRVDKIIEREKITLTLKIKEIADYLLKKPRFLFQKTYNLASVSRLTIIVAFIALLELSQQNRLKLRQKKLFGGLLVSSKERKAS